MRIKLINAKEIRLVNDAQSQKLVSLTSKLRINQSGCSLNKNVDNESHKKDEEWRDEEWRNNHNMTKHKTGVARH